MRCMLDILFNEGGIKSLHRLLGAHTYLVIQRRSRTSVMRFKQGPFLCYTSHLIEKERKLHSDDCRKIEGCLLIYLSDLFFKIVLVSS